MPVCATSFCHVDRLPFLLPPSPQDVYAYNFAGVNVALNKLATSLSVWAVGNGPAKAADGIEGEASYYNSGGSGAGEFWAVDLGAPTQLASVVFVNRAVMVVSCWTPPAAWTAAGINSGCDTRAFNNTLRVLDENNATLISARLTSAASQTFYMACAPSTTPTTTPTGTGTQTGTGAATASLTRGVSISASSTVTAAATSTGTQTPSMTATLTATAPVNGCYARYIRVANTPGVASMNFYELTATNATGVNIARGCAANSLSNAAGNDAGKA